MLGATTSFPGPLNSHNTSTLAAVRRHLAQLNFAGAATFDALGVPLLGGEFQLCKDLSFYVRRVAEPTPLNTLLMLFVLDQPVTRARAERAMAPVGLSAFVDAGLVREADGEVRAAVRLSGFNGLLLAHDRYDGGRRGLAEDHVLGVYPTTLTMSALTVRRRAARALDVGTGCGVLALLAAQHADQVIATDINARALNFASFNAALNGLTNVECRPGSLFEPVAGEQFDLVACNPPYVISPDSRYMFRDSGRPGDAFCEELVRTLPRHLAARGYASVLCNWIVRPGEPWPAPLERWLAGAPCDAWLLCTGLHDPLVYAALWNRDDEQDAYAAALDRWTRYAQDLGAGAIAQGAVILRRGSARSAWRRADRLVDTSFGSSEAPVERFFNGFDVLHTTTDEELLTCVPRLTPDQHLEQTSIVDDGKLVVRRTEASLTSGIRFRKTIDAFTMRLLALCNGRRTLREIAAELASDAEHPAEVRGACTATVRSLVASGFLALRQRRRAQVLEIPTR